GALSLRTGERQTQARVEQVDVLVHQRAGHPVSGSARIAGLRRASYHAAVDPELLEQGQKDERTLQTGPPSAPEDKLRRRRISRPLVEPHLPDPPGKRRLGLLLGRQVANAQRPGRVPKQQAEVQVMSVQERERRILDLVEFLFVEADLID